MDPAGLPALREAILHLHGVASHFVESVPVHETWQGETVWRGEVSVFNLVPGGPATRCYAWSYATEGTKRQFVAVLHAKGIDSPVAAVRAYIVQKHKEKR